MKLIENNSKWIESVWQKIDNKLSVATVNNRNIIPYTSNDGKYDDRGSENVSWWSNGFWGGMMWLMYQGTKNEEYKKTALRSEEILDRALEKFKMLDHDAGFMWHLVSEAESYMYVDTAIKVLKATDEHFCNYDVNHDSIVQMATERYPLNGVMRWVHVNLTYADFFFVESMLKLKDKEFCIW